MLHTSIKWDFQHDKVVIYNWYSLIIWYRITLHTMNKFFIVYCIGLHCIFCGIKYLIALRKSNQGSFFDCWKAFKLITTLVGQSIECCIETLNWLDQIENIHYHVWIKLKILYQHCVHCLSIYLYIFMAWIEGL